MTDTIEIGGTSVTPEGMEKYDPTTSLKIHGPPGSGKTMNATARVALLLEEYDYDLNDVAWITYRRSLAMDTLRRLADADVIEAKQLQNPETGKTKYIGTAHAVANRAVGGVGEMVGKKDKIRFCKTHNLQYTKRMPWETPTGKRVFDVFTYARKNGLDPTDPDDLRLIPTYQELIEEWNGSVPKLYEDWQQFKQDQDKYMFWEQLAAPLKNDVKLSRDVLVVDEYHDAYPLMADLAEYWAKHSEIVIVAGDPHQTINAFDGASPEYYERLDLPEIQLPIAWERPPAEHWEVAKNVLSTAHEPPEMDIRNRGGFQVTSAPKFKMEADEWIIPGVNESHTPAWVVKKHGTDTMFLTRTTHQLDAVARHLEAAGVLFETPRSSDVDGWGSQGDSINKRVDLYNALQKIRLLAPEAFDSSPNGLGEYGADKELRDPDDIILEAEEAAILVDHANSKFLKESRADVTEKAESWLVAEEQMTALELDELVSAEFWGTYTQSSRSLSYLIKSGPATNTRLGKRDMEALKNALFNHKYPVDAPEVKAYTIHASKGNQAETVCLYDGITKRTKDSMRRSPQAQRNEYRTWYVALTRSTKNMYVLRDAFDFVDRFLPKYILKMAKRGAEKADKEGIA